MAASRSLLSFGLILSLTLAVEVSHTSPAHAIVVCQNKKSPNKVKLRGSTCKKSEVLALDLSGLTLGSVGQPGADGQDGQDAANGIDGLACSLEKPSPKPPPSSRPSIPTGRPSSTSRFHSRRGAMRMTERFRSRDSPTMARSRSSSRISSR